VQTPKKENAKFSHHLLEYFTAVHRVDTAFKKIKMTCSKSHSILPLFLYIVLIMFHYS